MDGVADARVTLVTVVPLEGLPERPLVELPSCVAYFESGAEMGTDVVRDGQGLGDMSESRTISLNASVLLDRRRAWSMRRLRC